MGPTLLTITLWVKKIYIDRVVADIWGYMFLIFCIIKNNNNLLCAIEVAFNILNYIQQLY